MVFNTAMAGYQDHYRPIMQGPDPTYYPLIGNYGVNMKMQSHLASGRGRLVKNAPPF